MPTIWLVGVVYHFPDVGKMILYKNMEEDLIKKTDLQKIVDGGERIYEEIKSQYEPQENGRLLVIDIESGDVFLGD